MEKYFAKPCRKTGEKDIEGNVCAAIEMPEICEKPNYYIHVSLMIFDTGMVLSTIAILNFFGGYTYKWIAVCLLTFGIWIILTAFTSCYAVVMKDLAASLAALLMLTFFIVVQVATISYVRHKKLSLNSVFGSFFKDNVTLPVIVSITILIHVICWLFTVYFIEDCLTEMRKNTEYIPKHLEQTNDCKLLSVVILVCALVVFIVIHGIVITLHDIPTRNSISGHDDSLKYIYIFVKSVLSVTGILILTLGLHNLTDIYDNQDAADESPWFVSVFLVIFGLIILLVTFVDFCAVITENLNAMIFVLNWLNLILIVDFAIIMFILQWRDSWNLIEDEIKENYAKLVFLAAVVFGIHVISWIFSFWFYCKFRFDKLDSTVLHEIYVRDFTEDCFLY